jgi:Lrp/AsnC family transcriptional regulator, leucine-responsive regulatory protein
MLDEIDVKIIDILQKNGRTRRNDLAEQVHLSLPAVSHRLRRLEESGIITRYAAIVDHKRVGKDITAFIVVVVDSSKHYHQFVERSNHAPEILECHAVTGEGTHLLKIRTENTSTLEQLLSTIQSWAGVTSTRTQLVLSTSKEGNYIAITPIKHHS